MFTISQYICFILSWGDIIAKIGSDRQWFWCVMFMQLPVGVWLRTTPIILEFRILVVQIMINLIGFWYDMNDGVGQ